MTNHLRVNMKALFEYYPLSAIIHYSVDPHEASGNVIINRILYSSGPQH